MSLSLPLDVELCRLVLYGAFFGICTEAIVIAAEMSLSSDVFSLPTRCLMQDSGKFYDSLQRSLDTRVGYDQGQFSDHLIVCRMFQEWISWRIANSKPKIPSARHILLQKFCGVHAVHSTCLLVLENTVAWIATQLLGSLPPTSELYPSVKTLSTINKLDVKAFSKCKA